MEQLKLNLAIEYQGEQIPPLALNPDVISRLSKLRKKVFVFDSSEADEKAFKQRIVDYLEGKAEHTLTKTLWYIVWERNEKGLYGKYTYFNEYVQRVYLDKNFFEWAKLMCQILNEELARLDELNG